MSAPSVTAQLADVRAAFDSVAAVYDGPVGNNDVVQWMRKHLWRAVEDIAPPGARLLDLGCGTGIDAVRFASEGHEVLGIDWSPAMTAATQERIERSGVSARADTITLGMHELDRLERDDFDAIYSDLGAINCAPDIRMVAAGCHRLLRPRGHLVLSVIGRICPWEMAYYLARGKPGRAVVRSSREAIPAPLNGRTVWTRYYTPRELYQQVHDWFELESVRGLCLFSPPPYLLGVWKRFPRLCRLTSSLDDRTGAWPVLRGAGDHFLMVLTRRA
jgi:ubiquinone/menaquinone biosynthesis C-methylase UbiE